MRRAPGGRRTSSPLQERARGRSAGQVQSAPRWQSKCALGRAGLTSGWRGGSTRREEVTARRPEPGARSDLDPRPDRPRRLHSKCRPGAGRTGEPTRKPEASASRQRAYGLPPAQGADAGQALGVLTRAVIVGGLRAGGKRRRAASSTGPRRGGGRGRAAVPLRATTAAAVGLRAAGGRRRLQSNCEPLAGEPGRAGACGTSGRPGAD